MRTNQKTAKRLWIELANGLGVSTAEATTYAARIGESLAKETGCTIIVSPYANNCWGVCVVESSGVPGLVYQYRIETTVDELLDSRHTTLLPRIKARLARKVA